MELLFEPMFRVPFVTGLLLAAVLPQLGLLLRVRNEWLAALGFAHLAGAGGTLGSLLGAPVLLSALALAGLGVLLRGMLRMRGNDFYALMVLAGWSLMVLATSLSHHAHGLGQTLIDGQIYFTGRTHLLASAVFALVLLPLLPRLNRWLLHLRLFPWQDQANGRPVALRVLCFNLLLAAGVALAAMVMGVMATFALLFIPAWVAFGIAPGWRGACGWASALGVAAYLAAFVAALLADLPFGPVLVALLVLSILLRGLPLPRPVTR